MGMTRFTLKGAAAIIEDHQKSIRKLEAENDALKAELARAREEGRSMWEALGKPLSVSHEIHGPHDEGLQEDCFDCQRDRAEKADARVAELLKLIESAGEYIPVNAMWWDEALPILDFILDTEDREIFIPKDQPCATCGTPYQRHAEYPGCFFFHIAKKEAPR
jgi:hypothetical protein